MADGFLGRWSQRKTQGRQSDAVEPAEAPLVADPKGPIRTEPAEKLATDTESVPAVATGADADAGAVATPDAKHPTPERPPLTLADAGELSATSDFSPFVGRNVAPEVRNLAMKKLFADPHYNVMDGLDIYIDDYSKSQPIPVSVLRQMVSAKFLNLFDDQEDQDEEAKQDPITSTDMAGDSANPNTSTPDAAVAQFDAAAQAAPPDDPSAAPPQAPPDDHHADLRLQPDDASRSESDRDGAG